MQRGYIACCRPPEVLAWILFVVSTGAAGCSNTPARVSAPQVDASKVAQTLIESYDADGDGAIAGAELEACPSLSSSIELYDLNSDGSLAEAEIKDRIAELFSSRSAYFPLYAEVTLNGRPLRNAHVTLAPEPALADVLHPAEGTSNQKGYAVLAIAESDMPEDLRGIVRGVQTGLYRIHVEHKSQSLPDDVVSGDRLGVEITPADGNGGIPVAIKSR